LSHCEDKIFAGKSMGLRKSREIVLSLLTHLSAGSSKLRGWLLPSSASSSMVVATALSISLSLKVRIYQRGCSVNRIELTKLREKRLERHTQRKHAIDEMLIT